MSDMGEKQDNAMPKRHWSELNEVHEGFRHGKNFKIGKYCCIEEDVEVGDNVELGYFVLLRSGTRIGNDVFVDSYVRSSGDNRIGNDVTLRFGATIAKMVHVADGAFLSPNVMTIYSKHTGETSSGTRIGKGCHVGTNAVIGPNVSIVDGAVIGALAYVHRDIEEPGVYVGVPAKKMVDSDEDPLG